MPRMAFGNGPALVGMAPEIEAAINFGLEQERLTQRVHPRERPQILAPDKWDRVMENAERFLRRRGMIRL